MNQRTHRDRSFSSRRVLLLVAVGALAGCGGGGQSAEGASAVPHADTAASAARLALDSAAVRLAGVTVTPVAASVADALVANGTIGFDEDQAAVVAPRAEGRVVRVLADLGAGVERNQPLALLESAEVAQTRGEIASAQARLEVAQRNYEREKSLFEEKISSEREMLEAEGEYRMALADYNSAVARLASIGAGPGEGGTYTLLAPVSGVVVLRNARPGEVVGPDTNLFTVANLEHLWITADIYEAELSRVEEGAAAVIRPRALPGQQFAGKVTYAGGVVDPGSRTFKVRVEVENEGGLLRPGMYATVRIQATGEGPEQIVVPEVAVQELNGQAVVFVPGDEAGTFTARPVTVGESFGDGRLAITEGLAAEDEIVAEGAFRLKAELTKASFGEEE